MTIDSSIPHVCPKCGSVMEYYNDPVVIESSGVLEDYKRCVDCNYSITIHYDYCYWEED